jgi:transcriptional regulator NrdR family protein
MSTEIKDENNVNNYNFYNILKKQLLQNMNNFLRELDISFDYINKDIIRNIKKRVDATEDNDILFKALYEEILSNLNGYDNYFKIINKKVKTKDMLFLNDIVLLKLHFNVFDSESKNTKKTLVKYLDEFFTVSTFLKNVNNLGNDNETMFNEIKKMVEQLIIPNTEKSEPNVDEIIKNFDHINNFDQINITTDNPIFSQLNELIQNKDIMSIANELTSEIHSSDLDPMSIMSSLMSGNLQDNKLNNLISSIGEKITKKLNDGDIDKDMLEQHASKFLNNISQNQNDLMSIVKNMKM